TYFDHQFLYNDTVYTKNLFLAPVNFATQLGDSLIVTLIVNKDNSQCFPNDDGVDTITKVIHFIDECTPLWVGKWQGYWEGTDPILDTFTVLLETWSSQPPDCGNTRLINFEKDACSEIYLGSDSKWS